MSKRDLDELFREKFKGFKEIPDERVWEKIDATLGEKKKQRRIIPLWWKLGGVAALLAVLLYVMSPFESATIEAPVIITDVETEHNDSTKEDILEKTKLLEGPDIPENSVVESEPLSGEELKTDASSNGSGEGDLQNPKKRSQKNLGGQNAQIVENEAKNNSHKANIETEKALGHTPDHRASEGAIAHSEKDTDKIDGKGKDSGLIGQEVGPIQNLLNNQEKEGVAETKKPEKKSIFDEIEEQNEEKIADAHNQKWSIGANVAPVYYNSLGEGSPIHSSFAANSKTGQVNMSYGLSVAYAVNKKMSIRTGVNKVDYGYATNDVSFSSSLNALEGQIGNIDYRGPSENVVVASHTGKNSLSSPNIGFGDLGQNLSRAGNMSQQLGYVEVPVELDYALVDKRFGVNVVGGLSTLFLVDNSVSLTSGDLTTEIGSANNLNSVNFSTNIGLGVNYKLTPKVQLNVEPVFKYHLNTFSNTSGNFQPFSVGVYSGLNFKF